MVRRNMTRAELRPVRVGFLVMFLGAGSSAAGAAARLDAAHKKTAPEGGQGRAPCPGIDAASMPGRGIGGGSGYLPQSLFSRFVLRWSKGRHSPQPAVLLTGS